MKTQRIKTYWVTGASSGIGKVIAIELAKLGHKVIISSRSRENLEKIAVENTGDLIPLSCDVSNDEDMKRLFKNQKQVDYIDCVILCAGICKYIDYPNIDSEVIRDVTNINFMGCVNSICSALPLLHKSNSLHKNQKAHIVGVSSMSTYVGMPRAQAYGSSKAAMSYFLESLRTDLQKQIDVTIVYPGFVETPMTQNNDFPMPFQVTVDEAASTILKNLEKRPYKIQFPYRLHFILKCMSCFSSVWYSLIAPRLSRSEAS